MLDQFLPDDDAIIQARAEYLAQEEQLQVEELASQAAKQRVEAANLNSEVLVAVSQGSQG